MTDSKPVKELYVGKNKKLWRMMGIKDAKLRRDIMQKDDPNGWTYEANRIAYKEAYEAECALLLITGDYL